MAHDPGEGDPDVAVDELLVGRAGGGVVVDAGPLDVPPVTLFADRGDVVLIRPLLAHCSNRSFPNTNCHRRILHLEFAGRVHGRGMLSMYAFQVRPLPSTWSIRFWPENRCGVLLADCICASVNEAPSVASPLSGTNSSGAQVTPAPALQSSKMPW